MEHIFGVAKNSIIFWLCLVFLKCIWENKVDAGPSPPPPTHTNTNTHWAQKVSEDGQEKQQQSNEPSLLTLTTKATSPLFIRNIRSLIIFQFKLQSSSFQLKLSSFLGILASVINWYDFFACFTDLKNFYIHNIAPIPTKVRNRAKIRDRYNQAPHLTQDTNGKVTTSQFNIINESQGVNPFPAGDHKASINRREQKYRNI